MLHVDPKIEQQMLETMDWDKLEAHIGNEIYAGLAILEQLEYAGRVRAHGHHWRQRLVKEILKEVNERRNEEKPR